MGKAGAVTDWSEWRPVAGLPAPLTPFQILWLNLVTDGVPALALALEPGEQGLMERTPAEPGESIFARGIGSYIRGLLGQPQDRPQPTGPAQVERHRTLAPVAALEEAAGLLVGRGP